MSVSLLLDAHICLVVLGADGHGVGVEHRRRFLDRHLPAPKISHFSFFLPTQKARHGKSFSFGFLRRHMSLTLLRMRRVINLSRHFRTVVLE